MEVEARNITADGPDLFQFNFVIDASPIYLTLDASISVLGGSFTDGDFDYEVAPASKTHTQRTRQLSRDTSFGEVIGENVEIERVHDVSSFYDHADDLFIVSDVDRFAAILGDVDGFGGLQDQLSPYSPPVFPLNSGDFFHRFDDIVTKTRTSNGDEVQRDVVTTVFAPRFEGSILGEDLKMIISLGVSISSAPSFGDTFDVEIDASSWGSAELRDIRGTWGGTDTDDKGIGYTWSITLG